MKTTGEHMRLFVSTALFFAAIPAQAVAQAAPSHLAGDTVLIIRHAEKPADGPGLTAQGEARAQAYIRYFEPFHEGSFNLHVDALYAGADSGNSMRPRLTLEPLSKATGIPLDTAIGTKNPEALVSQLRSTPHGHTPLIAWRHGQIPALLRAFGASPETLLPDGSWPDSVFDNVIVLHFDQAGKLTAQTLVHETLQVAPTR